MKTSIETINNHLVTVIRKPFDAEWVREQLAMGVPVVVIDNELECWQVFGRANAFPWLSASSLNDRRVDSLYSACITHTLTILPALPKHPTPEDAGLLYRYASEGLFVVGTGHDGALYPYGLGLSGILHLSKTHKGKAEITHATDTEGNRVEVAIQPTNTREEV